MKQTPKDKGPTPSHEIEFIGGPYDGHKEAELAHRSRPPAKVARQEGMSTARLEAHFLSRCLSVLG